MFIEREMGRKREREGEREERESCAVLAEAGLAVSTLQPALSLQKCQQE